MALTPLAGPQCYAYYSEDDGIELRLTALRPAVIGRVRYRAEGPANQLDGPIEGILRGDTLLADYWFETEGVRSPVAAPIAFLRRGNQFVEGFGDIAEQGGRFRFKRVASIRFDTARVLRPVACPALPAVR